MSVKKQDNRVQMEKETEEHILVCISPSPSNVHIIQTAAKMSRAYQGILTALFVETPFFSEKSSEDRERLQANCSFAKELGADLEQVSGEDVAFQIAEFARLNGITKIVIGRSNAAGRHRFGKKTLTDRLISYAPNVDIFIIPDIHADSNYRLREEKMRRPILSVSNILLMILSLGIATGLSILFYHFGFTDANIITVYILGVLITSVVTSHIVYSVVASIASVLIFNFLFTDPRYTFLAYDMGYPMTFIVMMLASLLTGTLAARLKSFAEQSARQAYRTKILLDTSQLLQQTEGMIEIFHAASDQLAKLTGRKIRIYLPSERNLNELLKNEDKKRELRYPIRLGNKIYGVAGIDVQKNPMDVFENSIVLSILGECALSLENENNIREKEKAAVLAQNEQLRVNLLRTISHDLRTPLTSISGNASNLLTNDSNFDVETRKQLYSDIYDDSLWLINLVENLLSVTRMEGEGVKIHMTAEVVDEVIAEALLHLDRRSCEYKITVEQEEEIILAKMDAKLIIQVMINLINNAIKYTPSGSEIHIRSWKEEDIVLISVSDNGPGVSDSMKEHLFELFYTGDHAVTDGRRSMGLGLALCKSIVNAHGGEIFVADAPTGGCEFTFTLPAEEVRLYE